MYTDEQLMDQYRNGDERAFSLLHARYRPLVQRIVQRHVFRSADVEDLVQHTFAQLHAARDSYRSGELLRPWLCTMALNACRDYGRRAKRRPELSFDMDVLAVHMPEELPGERNEVRAPLIAALDSLSEVTRQIFQEHFLADRALVDIARDLGANPSTVRVRMHRGCRQLREALAE